MSEFIAVYSRNIECWVFKWPTNNCNVQILELQLKFWIFRNLKPLFSTFTSFSFGGQKARGLWMWINPCDPYCMLYVHSRWLWTKNVQIIIKNSGLYQLYKHCTSGSTRYLWVSDLLPSPILKIIAIMLYNGASVFFSKSKLEFFHGNCTFLLQNRPMCRTAQPSKVGTCISFAFISHNRTPKVVIGCTVL